MDSSSSEKNSAPEARSVAREARREVVRDAGHRGGPARSGRHVRPELEAAATRDPAAYETEQDTSRYHSDRDTEQRQTESRQVFHGGNVAPRA
jgi:hypothetical protein